LPANNSRATNNNATANFGDLRSIRISPLAIMVLFGRQQVDLTNPESTEAIPGLLYPLFELCAP
jgi:hypothetical protein